MEKRVLIAVVLSFALISVYNYMFPAPASKQPQTQSTSAGTAQVQPLPQSAQTPSAVITPQSSSEQLVEVETDLYRAVFSNHGASLKELILKKYREDASAQSKNVVMVSETDPAQYPLQTSWTNLFQDAQTIYAISTSRLMVTKGADNTIVFSTKLPSGLTYRKTYSFAPGSYLISLDCSFENSSSVPVNGSLSLSYTNRVPQETAKIKYADFSVPVNVAGKVDYVTLKDLLKTPRTFEKDVAWAAFGDKYFLSALIADHNNIASVRVSRDSSLVTRTVTTAPLSVAPGARMSQLHKIYIGPKEIDTLKATGVGLEEAIDLGWFSMLAKPLLHALKFFYRYTGNYGLAIIIITFILKIVFYPLTHSSYRSMKQMQKLQPKMTAIREKLKNDKDAMNKAIMELYRDHKVNPLGGCLPMLVQIPVFFALYKALMFSIELRQAPFYFWLTDLSAQDPYYITPILMGASMVIQQRMTPSTMDPAQAKIMMFLPVIFTFMFLNFPSGLVIYWLVNNILTILQQWRINHLLKEA